MPVKAGTPYLLKEEFGLDPQNPRDDIHDAYDGMHKSALNDTHISKIPKYKWDFSDRSTVLEGFRMFRVAKKYWLLREVCERLEKRSTCISQSILYYSNCTESKVKVNPLVANLEKLRS